MNVNHHLRLPKMQFTEIEIDTFCPKCKKFALFKIFCTVRILIFMHLDSVLYFIYFQ